MMNILKELVRVNIQTIVEKPELYIVARSRSNDEQLSYIETRLSCITELKQKFYVNDIEITDKMRLFHGDGPSVQFERGQQKGRNYYCPCGCQADRATELDHAFRCPYKTVTMKQNTVLAASVQRANSIRRNPKPFENLSKDEIELEILEEKLYWNRKMKKNEIERILKIELQGTNRVPAMLFLNPVESFESLYS